jgi:hypothetical protein
MGASSSAGFVFLAIVHELWRRYADFVVSRPPRVAVGFDVVDIQRETREPMWWT